MNAAMDCTATPISQRTQAYCDLYEQAVTEAAFLWLLRSIKVEQPQPTLAVIAELDARIQDELDGLMTSPLGWKYCETALSLGEPGEQFTATVVALRSQETRRVQTAVETGLSNPRSTPGLISALGWLPPDLVQPWIGRFLHGKDLNHKFLGVAACGVRREDPGELLTDILRREDCQKHIPLHARALRLIGECRRGDLLPALHTATASQEPSLVFWANWSTILLGQHAAVKNLQPLVFNGGPLQTRAIQLVFRALPIEPAREWISTLAKDPANARAVITATEALGDPHAVSWLIGKMADPLLARLAAEAFTFITGVDLIKHQLHKDPHPVVAPIPNDDADDAQVGLDEDENLPWPDVEKIAALWGNHGANFKAGQRYFLGKPIAPDWLKHKIAEGTMRQRHAAALELALIDPSSRLINTRAKAMS